MRTASPAALADLLHLLASGGDATDHPPPPVRG